MTDDMQWRRSILSNGLRVLVFPRPSAHTSQLSIAVEYGSNHEPKKLAGAAHFLEHMLAGGSTKRIELSRSIEDSGGIFNLYTEHEYTMVSLDVLPEQLANASLIVSKLLFDDGFETEKLKRERKIILNEIAEDLDDPAELVEQLALENLFKKHPVRRPVAGYEKTVKALTLEQLHNEHRANYVPQNMVLIFTGACSQENIESVLKNFQDRKGKAASLEKTCFAEEAKPKPLVVKKKRGIAQSYLFIGARTVCSSHPDMPVLDLIGTILTGGASSRLFIALREKEGLTYDVRAETNRGKDFGFFSVSCAVNNDNLSKAKDLIMKELAKLTREKVPNDELKKNKNLILAGILRGVDNPIDCPEILAFLEIQFGSERALDDYVSKIKAVSSESILQTANKYLQENALSTAFLKK
jgi:predicted Zn-dependent peptidase